MQQAVQTMHVFIQVVYICIHVNAHSRLVSSAGYFSYINKRNTTTVQINIIACSHTTRMKRCIVKLATHWDDEPPIRLLR